MTAPHDALDDVDRVFLEKLRLAVCVLLDVGKDPGVLNTAFESELGLFKDRVERALLS